MLNLKFIMDVQDPFFLLYDDKGVVVRHGLYEEDTKEFQNILDNLEERFSIDVLCNEDYEIIGFKSQTEKDEIIGDAFMLFGMAKKALSHKYKFSEYPDLSSVYKMPVMAN